MFDLGNVLQSTRERLTDHPELDDYAREHASAFVGSLVQRYETLADDMDAFGDALPAGMDTVHAGRFFKDQSGEYMDAFGGDRSQYSWAVDFHMNELLGREMDERHQNQIVASYALTFVRDAFGAAAAEFNTPQVA